MSVIKINNGVMPIMIPKVSVIDSTDSKITILPNLFYKWGIMESLEIDLESGPANELAEYMFQFKSGENPTQLILPANLKWASDNTIKPNTTYQVSILNNIILMCAA